MAKPKAASVAADAGESDLQQVAHRSEQSALQSAKQNLSYLYNPKSSAGAAPARFRTRTLLKSLHYIGVFVFWRIVRYAKYIAAGAAATLLGATAIGSVVSGAAWLIAPPTITAAIGTGIIWSIARFGFRKAARRVGYVRQKEIETGRPYGGPIPEPNMLQDTFI